MLPVVVCVAGKHSGRLLLPVLVLPVRSASNAPRAKERGTQSNIVRPSLARGASPSTPELCTTTTR